MAMLLAYLTAKCNPAVISMTIYALDHLNEEEARKNSKHLFIEITVRRYPVFQHFSSMEIFN